MQKVKIEKGIREHQFLEIQWQHPGNALPSRCMTDLFFIEGRIVVLVTENMRDVENTGMNITTGAEYIATEVMNWIHSNTCCHAIAMVYVEHWIGRKDSDPRRSESFDLVQFSWDSDQDRFKDPRWTPLPRFAVESLIGRPVPQHCTH